MAKKTVDKNEPVESGNVAPANGVGDNFGKDVSTDPVESVKETLRHADHSAAGADRAANGPVSDYGRGELERNEPEPESAAERKTRYGKMAQAGLKMDGHSAYEEYQQYLRNVNALRDEGKEVDLNTIQRLADLKAKAQSELDKHGLSSSVAL